MRISDWSSDVCSSDLCWAGAGVRAGLCAYRRDAGARGGGVGRCRPLTLMLAKRCAEFKKGRPRVKPGVTVIYRHFSLSYIIQIGSKSFRFIPGDSGDGAMAREVRRGSRGKSGAVWGDGSSEERRVGQEWVRTCRSGW